MSSVSGSSGDGIPPILHSVYANGPFKSCVECETDLAETGLPYAIEKVVRNGEVVFEYALCSSCTMTLVQEFSEESLENIRQYLESEPDAIDPLVFERMAWAMHGSDDEADTGDGPPPLPPQIVDRCRRCGRGDDRFEGEHTVMGLLVGRQLITNINTICGACTEGMEEILSQKTRDLHDDFIERNFPGVPANLDIPVGIMGI